MEKDSTLRVIPEPEVEQLFVTKAFLPPLDEFQALVKTIWESGWLTNNGEMLRELEAGLQQQCRTTNVSVVNNGTVALQIAIRALGVSKEIITTPFSYVATTSSIVWEHCTPRFADIDPNTLNLDPDSIEKMITPDTEAILATHVFGVPCDVVRIEEIADRHGLKVIYDAAHAFGVSYGGKPLVTWGDISTLSFHATKLFHTIEGGAIITSNENLFTRVNYMRNFGHKGQEDFQGLGINGKMSEFHAAMGVLNMKYLERILASRKVSWHNYYEAFKDVDEIVLQDIPTSTEYNYAYFSVVLQSETVLDRVVARLAGEGIVPRRYFYPSLNKLPYVSASCPVAEDISCRILCLPLFTGISLEGQRRVIDGVISAL